MKEEEIIKILNTVIQANKFDGVYTSIDIIIEAIQGLLNLYNKEKEKNKKLNKYITDKVKTGKEIQTFINKGYVEQEYISKDKIRKLKEYYEDSLKYAENEIESNNIYVSIKILEKILEE